ncbi:MAG: hypothetical protein J2O44_07545 [Porphyrobacter sp.]|nr:hypothetical protein [Porphyrobacter sp.]
MPALACLALTGCFLQPGKFDSTLVLRQDGSFTFTYKGQVYLLALSKIADLAVKADANGDAFVQEPCHDEEFNEHPCSAEEIAEQKRTWEEEKQKKQQEAAQNAEMMRAMLGGIDPADPAAAKDLAERLRHQAGWRSVTYLGDGLFEVDFALQSRLTHDFAFPTIERFPMADTFVVASRRIDGTIRVDAPGFTGQSATNPMQGALGAALGGAAASGAVADKGASAASPSLGIPDIDGTFRIVTDGEVLANNTDEGPQPGPGGKVLQWRITKRAQAAPMALVRLAP